MFDLSLADNLCRVFVFEHLRLDNEEFFQHYQYEQELGMVRGPILNKKQHFELVDRD